MTIVGNHTPHLVFFYYECNYRYDGKAPQRDLPFGSLIATTQ